MKSINPILAGLLFMAASPAFAQGSKPMATVPVKDAAAADSISVPTALSYTFADLGYTQTKFDKNDLKADGFGVAGSYVLPAEWLPASIAGSLYAIAGYSLAETEKRSGSSIEITDLRLGGGYRLGMSSTFDLKAELDFLQKEEKTKGVRPGSVDDTGFRLGIGARYLITPQIEAGGGLRYVDIGADSETVLEVSGLYHIAQGFSAFVNAATSSDATSFGLGGRYNFSF